MAFGLFKKSGGAGGQARDPRKARKFFEHARTVADANNYDYAIECYINGLKHDPDNMDVHEALREVSLRRKAAGGKPAGLGQRFGGGGSSIDRMLHAELLLAKDPLNPRLMRDVMKHAADADEEESDLHMGEVAYWVGCLLLEFNTQAKKPSKSLYVEAKDLFSRIEAWAKAVEACKHALRLDQSDDKLLANLKDLEAERTMQEGGYSGDQKVEEGGYRKFVRDAASQEALQQEEAAAGGAATEADKAIEHRRAEYEEDPDDIDRLQKLVDLLVKKGTEASEEEAIELLNKAHQQTDQARYQFRIGDIRMRQYARQMRDLKKQLDAAGEDAELKKQYEEVRKQRLAFELEEYQRRVKAYPTDMPLRFELGKRQYQSGQVDDAIGSFQQAKADPKNRAAAHQYLGSCYLHKEWLDEAIDTLRAGIEHHPGDDDRLGLELRYMLMDALEKSARKTQDAEKAKEAQKLASQILQTDIKFRDIQQRLEGIRKLQEEIG